MSQFSGNSMGVVGHQTSLPRCYGLYQVNISQNTKLTFYPVNALYIYINARFAYVRFASGLIKDCAKLLHILALVFFATCYTNWDLFFVYYFFYKDNYKDLKMVFCTKQNITVKLDADFIGSSVKPKMMLIFTTLLFLLCSTFLCFSALHSR